MGIHQEESIPGQFTAAELKRHISRLSPQPLHGIIVVKKNLENRWVVAELILQDKSRRKSLQRYQHSQHKGGTPGILLTAQGRQGKSFVTLDTAVNDLRAAAPLVETVTIEIGL